MRKSYLKSGTIKLVLDGAGYHRSDIVKDEAKKQNIELIYLPPYSPNLNPIERLWKVMNKHARNGEFFLRRKSFDGELERFFLPHYQKSLTHSIVGLMTIFRF